MVNSPWLVAGVAGPGSPSSSFTLIRDCSTWTCSPHRHRGHSPTVDVSWAHNEKSKDRLGMHSIRRMTKLGGEEVPRCKRQRIEQILLS